MRSDGKSVKPVKYFAALLYRDETALTSALEQLSHAWSDIDYHSPAFAFDQTDYYQPEMGAHLKRILVSFGELVLPDRLVALKQLAGEIEQTLCIEQRRTVNIDPGYLDLFKVVLASYKARGNKIYLGDGVWADPTLYYAKGRFQTFPWSFPDFKTGTYDESLLEIRRLYKAALRWL